MTCRECHGRTPSTAATTPAAATAAAPAPEGTVAVAAKGVDAAALPAITDADINAAGAGLDPEAATRALRGAAYVLLAVDGSWKQARAISHSMATLYHREALFSSVFKALFSLL